MAFIKCKMCGGELEIQANSTVAECEYCGSRQTVPTADNEKKLTLFTRANKLRASCEFDKAAGVYESIIADFPSEAEAYWGLVLCKYGIEYVDDPATGKKVPTCHRSSFNSIFDDSDFEQALENADVVARKVYRDEAKAIEEIRKGIIDVSGKEQPYDIFICYKETDENDERTIDSVIAQDVYDELTKKKYRVFFSRITLENKLGQEYEPYIFAALNSAKIMLAFGTDYEYYNAVWVKNEWSRFLKLMAKDKSKHLIPCYKNIDAYDMPKEFAKLQAQDMGKVGAIQDLIRGIEKLLPKTKQEEIVVQERVLLDDSSINKKISSLVDRGYMALDDKDWEKADSFFEEVLNNDSRNYKALIGKALIVEKCCSLDEFIDECISEYNYEYDDLDWIYLEKDNEHIDNAVKQYEIDGYLFEDDIEKKYDFDLKYSSLVSLRIAEYNEIQTKWNKNLWFAKVEKYLTRQEAEKYYLSKNKVFNCLNNRIEEAKALAETAKNNLQQEYADFLVKADNEVKALYSEKLKEKDEDYQSLISQLQNNLTITELEEIKSIFESYNDYRDSKTYTKNCEEKIKELIAKQKRSERNWKLLISLSIILIFIGLFTKYFIVIPYRLYHSDYQNAISLMDDKKFDAAISIFSKLNGYYDSDKQIQKAISEKYAYSESLLSNGQYSEAIKNFTELGDYSDSKNKVLASKYSYACSLYTEGQYKEATDTFAELGDYADSKNKLIECKYNYAKTLMNANQYVEAINIFAELDGYADSSKQIKIAKEKQYILAFSYLAKEDDYRALQAFSPIGDYKYSEEYINKILTKHKFNLFGSGIDAGYYHTVGLKSDGTVVAIGANTCGQCNVNEWNNIIAVSTGYYHTVGLKSDGTVVALGDNKYGQCDVSEWKNIIAISADNFYTVGLKSDGTVVATGRNSDGQCDVKQWKDIIAISAGNYHTIGLKSDGTVVATGRNKDGECNVSEWKNIIAISAGDYHTVGLRSDGTVVATGRNSDGECNVTQWKDIIAVSAGNYHTVGLKSDGTVVATGRNKDGECNVSEWKDILAVSAGDYCTVGIKIDGTAVAVGSNNFGKINIENWSNLKIPLSIRIVSNK